MLVKSTEVPDADTDVPDVNIPAPIGAAVNVAICDELIDIAVVPAPVPVLISNAPVLSGVKLNPFVALPAVITVAITYP
jgi:hypothetical protein